MNKEPKKISIMDCHEVFAIPGADNIIDCVNPQTGRTWHYGLSLDEMREREKKPEIQKLNFEAFLADKAKRQKSPVEWTETTEEKYQEMLEVLPPAAWHGGGFMVGEAYDHCAATGKPRFQAFKRKDGKHFKANRPMSHAEFCQIFGPGANYYVS